MAQKADLALDSRDILLCIADQLETAEDLINLYYATGERGTIEKLGFDTPDGRALFAGILTRDKFVFKRALRVGLRDFPNGLFELCLPDFWAPSWMGADLDAPYTFGVEIGAYSGHTALQCAIIAGNLEFVEILLRAGADIDYAPPEWCANCLGRGQAGLELDGGPFDASIAKNSPLHFAICYGHDDIAEMLIDKGAVPATNFHDFIPGNRAAHRGLWIAPHNGNERSLTPLHELCSRHFPEDDDGTDGTTVRIAEAYINKYPATWDSVTSWGETALSRACRHGRFRFAYWLLTSYPHCDTDNTVPWGGPESLLHVALSAAVRIWSRQQPRQTGPLADEYKIGIESDFPYLPLLIEELIPLCGGVSQRGVDSRSPLHLIALLGGDASELTEGLSSIVEQLLLAGADVTIEDKDGLTPLDTVKRFHSPLVGSTRWRTLAPIPPRDPRYDQGHVPGTFVYLLNQTRLSKRVFDHGGLRMVAPDHGNHRRFWISTLWQTQRNDSAVWQDSAKNFWWTFDPAGPKGGRLRHWCPRESQRVGADHYLDLPMRDIICVEWAQHRPQARIHRIILTLNTGLPEIPGLRFRNDKIYLEFEGLGGGGQLGSHHYSSFLSWSLPYGLIVKEITSTKMASNFRAMRDARV
ncbi:hypothetical protein CMEL01_16802 [Colletotrichum melonis]|uniref:Ankyrin repeat protein n=1 Tax=Colletotrichum melonis TaxID=1209925 RepID=A0AAI9U0U8_9PEZI|nr:hypothetical protein CMEL01_16802 [Colletotrichum melonis]